MKNKKIELPLRNVDRSSNVKDPIKILFDVDYIATLSIKEYQSEGHIVPNTCVLFKSLKTFDSASGTKWEDAIVLAISKNDLVKKLTDLGIIEIV